MYECVSSANTLALVNIDLSVSSSKVTCRENVLTKIINPIICSVFPSDSIPTQQPVTHSKLLISLFWSPSPFLSSIFMFLHSNPSIFLDSNNSYLFPGRKKTTKTPTERWHKNVENERENHQHKSHFYYQTKCLFQSYISKNTIHVNANMHRWTLSLPLSSLSLFHVMANCHWALI